MSSQNMDRRLRYVALEEVRNQAQEREDLYLNFVSKFKKLEYEADMVATKMVSTPQQKRIILDYCQAADHLNHLIEQFEAELTTREKKVFEAWIYLGVNEMIRHHKSLRFLREYFSIDELKAFILNEEVRPGYIARIYNPEFAGWQKNWFKNQICWLMENYTHVVHSNLVAFIQPVDQYFQLIKMKGDLTLLNKTGKKL